MVVQTTDPTTDNGCQPCAQCPSGYVNVIQVGFDATNACAGIGQTHSSCQPDSFAGALEPNQVCNAYPLVSLLRSYDRL